MDNRLFKRLFGDFAPSTGDLVFSKSGELLGLMVNSDYCLVLNRLDVAGAVPTGEAAGGLPTRAPLEAVRQAFDRLPLKLQ